MKTKIIITILSALVIFCFFLVVALLDRDDKTDKKSETTKTTVQATNNKSIASTPDQKATSSVSNLSKIVDTGQTKCSNDSTQISCPSRGSFSGQDAQYSSNQPSYQDNGDGTVTDLVTGLMWAKNAGEKVSYEAAVKNAKGYDLAGYDDWRVPTIKELYTLINFNGEDINPTNTSTAELTPFIDTNYFDFEYGNTSAGERIIDSQWVTSSKYVSTVMNSQECFFGVNFADGRIKCYPTGGDRSKGYFARYVRGSSYGDNNFSDNEDGTITDRATELIWQQNDSQKGMKWKEALAYCEELSFAEHNDWRLPNAKELQGIVDYTRSPDTTDSPALDPLFVSTQITNEAGSKDWPFYWTGTTHINEGNLRAAAYISFGRAMGNMNGKWIDVHGAGSQRSDPKIGSASDYPTGRGPQGDAIRINNYVRCVRGGAKLLAVNEISDLNSDSYPANAELESSTPSVPSSSQSSPGPQNSGSLQGPPPEAVSACNNKSSGSSCSFSGIQGTISGQCRSINNQLACVPEGAPPMR